MRSRSFLTVFFYVSLTFALESSSWSLRSALRHASQKRANLNRLNSRAIPTGWSYVGCATDGSARALSYSFTSSSLTQDSCIATCDSLGYIYGAPEYTNQCYCGSTLANGLGVSTASAECNMPCAGNSSQICGGNYRMSLFQKTSSVATSAWTLTQACAVDTSSRVLQGYSVTISALTPALCQSTCASQGFTIAGVEDGSQCYCGNSFVGGTPATASTSDCSTPCGGDSSSTCGGAWRIQIYIASGATTTATTISTTTTTTSALASTSTGWVLSNACAVDTSARFLQGYSVTTSSLTPALCQFTCAGQGFTIAGVEYGSQCYCGNSFVGGTPATASTSDCNTPCAGDSSSTCGGSWLLQIYTASGATTTATTTSTTTASAPVSTSTGWVLSNACAVDTSSRILQGYSVTISALTPVLCQSTCASNGYTISGVEYGTQCYCGNSFVGGTPAAASTSDCSTPCGGDSSSACGGAWRIQIYTASGTTTTATTPSTTTSAPASTSTGWVLSNACAVDTSPRILEGYTVTTSSLTPALCQSTCASQGYTISGVEYGTQCYCGSSFVGGTPANASTSDCDTPCGGDSSSSCGGFWRIQIYTSAAATTSSSSTTTTTFTSSSTTTTTSTSSSAAPTATVTAPYFVLYGDQATSGTIGPPAVSAINGFNVFALSFLLTEGAYDKAAEWASLTDAQRQTIKTQYAAAGMKLIVSAFGSTDSPTTSGANAITTANTMAQWVVQYQLDGIDVDYEDFTAVNKGDGSAEAWLISFTTQLRSVLPQGTYIITHAPVAPWFAPNYWGGGGYLKVHQNVGSIIDWYNIQFYNQGDTEYTTCANLLTQSSTVFPQTALFQIAANGVPLTKLVLGKPATNASATNGYVAPSTLATCLSTAKGQGWTGGVSVWEYPGAAASWIATVRASSWPVGN
ncbi:hypothetical protein DFH07DRAFT_921710 [Mycena maculata]|uniref:Chitinase n=1 Tax=Mycena maculata TaxID=230809 RepID=A0AAD7NB31_9AGAR|nr:hypothetical protein DFH07DRAFT_921710 [Mycena maculata]